MKITTINLDSYTKNGLKNVKMDHLGRVVLVAGRNGSGKTRLLDLIGKWTQETLSGLGGNQNRHEFCRNFWGDPGIQYTGEIPRNGWWMDSERLKDYFKVRMQMSNAKDAKAVRDELYQIEFDGPESPDIVRFVPKITELSDPSDMTKTERNENARQVEVVGVARIEKNELARVQTIQDRWWNATHQESKISDNEKLDAIANYEGLCSVVDRLQYCPV